MTKERIQELLLIAETKLAEEVEIHRSMLERHMPVVISSKHERDVKNWEDIVEIINVALDSYTTEATGPLIRHDENGNEYWNFGNAPIQGQVPDMVNSPHHYTAGQYEVIDVIKDWLSPEEFRGYIKGNLIKYISRELHKNGDEDMKKAEFYLHYFNTDGEKGVK